MNAETKVAELSRHLIRTTEPTGSVADSGGPRFTLTQRIRFLFVLFLFVVPVVAGGVYNFVIATPRFASNLSFVVRTADASTSRFSFFNMTKANGEDESEAIIAYVRSRALLGAIDGDGAVRAMFAGRGLDIFSRFPSLVNGRSGEDFFRHFGRHVSADFDRGTGVTTIEVQGFSARQAQMIARRIRNASEAMVNRLNDRARLGLISSAERDERAAEDHLAEVLRRLNQLRDKQGILEPGLQAGAAVKLSAAAESELAAINVELHQASRSSPDSPVLPQWRTRKAAIEAELSRQDRNQVGNPQALASRMRDLEEISAKRQVAERRLLGASLGLVSAHRSADRQRLYIENIADPSLPDEARYPRAWWNMLFLALICGAVLWIALSLSELIVGDE
jgi:capsular polysaccharide transport system permease protein